MDNNNSKKENRSMYIYTALIFVVALLLILVAFFSQTNVSKWGKRAEEYSTPAPAATESNQNAEKLAKIANMVPPLKKENTELKAQITIYKSLISANAYIADGKLTEAETEFATIDETALSAEQLILYEEIKNKINEGKEQ